MTDSSNTHPDKTISNSSLGHQIRLWQENEYALLIANAMPNGVVILNENRQIVFANELFLQLTRNESMNSIVGKRPGDAFHCVNADIEQKGCGYSLFCKNCRAVHAILSSIKGIEAVEECYVERADNLPPLRLRIWTTPVVLNGEKFTVFAIEDIHIEKEHSTLVQKLKKMSETDALTGLHNRRYLYNEAERELSRAERYQYPISLFMIDIDHFKQVNDTYGHEIGDRVLVKFTRIIRESMRKMDLIVRWGGEEFVILLPETDAEKTNAAAQRLCKNVENMLVKTERGNINITISIGIAGNYGSQTISFDELIKQADDALYQAKAAGRNCIVHWNDMNTTKNQ